MHEDGQHASARNTFAAVLRQEGPGFRNNDNFVGFPNSMTIQDDIHNHEDDSVCVFYAVHVPSWRPLRNRSEIRSELLAPGHEVTACQENVFRLYIQSSTLGHKYEI